MAVKPPLLPAHLRPHVEPFLARRVMAPGTLRGNDVESIVGPPVPAIDPVTGQPVATPNTGGLGASMPAPGQAPPVALVSGVNGVGGAFAIGVAEAIIVLSGNPNRQLLIVANLGTALAYVQFDNPTASVMGVPLVGGATLTLDVKVPTNPVSIYSPLGTSVYAYEG